MPIFDEIMKNYVKENVITESTIYSSNKFLISVDRDSGRYGYGSSYFKYYVKKQGKWFVARLLLCKADFTNTEHSNSAATSKGKLGNVTNLTKLSSSESDKLMEILSSQCTTIKYTSLGATTIYSAMIIEANLLAGVSVSDINKYKNYNPEECPRPILPFNCDIPDYTKI